MAAPQLTAYRQGQGVVSGDQLNTFESTCDTFADLRAFIGVPGLQVWARGGGAVNDGQGGPFYWNANGTADDGTNNIKPTGAALGCWTRLDISPLNFGGQLLYGLPVFIEGTPTASEEYPVFLPPFPSTLPVGLTNGIYPSRFRIRTNPTATLTVTLQKNQVSIGTVVFSTGGVPTVTFTTETAFDITADDFSLLFPASPDATGAGLAFTFVFTITP